MSTIPPSGDIPPPPEPVPPPPAPAAPPAPMHPAYPAYPAYPSATPAGFPAHPAVPSSGWAPAGPAPGVVYAGFWTRFAGYLLDTLLITAAEAAVTVPLVFVPLVQFVREHPVVNGQALPALPAELTNRFAILGVLGGVVSGLYFGGLVAWQGRTVGQRAAGTIVVRAEDGGKLPPGRSFLRAIVFWGPGLLSALPGIGSVAGLLAFISLLSVAWDPRKQGWHDKLGTALVVRRLPQGGWRG